MIATATNLKIARGRKRWTQKQLADAAGVGIATITNIERGSTADPRPDTLDRIAQALEIDPALLIQAALPTPPARSETDRESTVRDPQPHHAINGDRHTPRRKRGKAKSARRRT